MSLPIGKFVGWVSDPTGLLWFRQGSFLTAGRDGVPTYVLERKP